jgi:hypothetical protein
VRRPSLVAATLALAAVVGVLAWAFAEEHDDEPVLGPRIVVPAANTADDRDRPERRSRPKSSGRDRKRGDASPPAEAPSTESGGAAPPVTPQAPLPSGDDDFDDDAAGGDDDGGDAGDD